MKQPRAEVQWKPPLGLEGSKVRGMFLDLGSSSHHTGLGTTVTGPVERGRSASLRTHRYQ